MAPEVQLQLATTLEGLGYDSLWTSDHIIVPDGESYIPETMHEPLALLSWLAAHTSRVDLGISVLVLPPPSAGRPSWATAGIRSTCPRPHYAPGLTPTTLSASGSADRPGG